MNKDQSLHIQAFIEQAGELKVAVVGETILDRFVKVVYEGQSMKSFCPVFRYYEEEVKPEEQLGGAAAIAQHLTHFVKEVVLVSNAREDIVKTRLIDKDDQKKHVEINKFDRREFGVPQVPADCDLVIVADFGHGFCDQLQVQGKYHYMTQTNSNNFGYNRMSKWKAYPKKSACMDLREASLQLNKRNSFSERKDMCSLYGYELGAEKLFLTLGARGSVYYDGKNYLRQEAIKAPVVDTIGAGDTFYAFAALAAEMDSQIQSDIMLVPALAASLSCTWLCNEQQVSRKKLLDHATRYLR